MRIRPGYVVRLNGYRSDAEYPKEATEGDVGLVVGFDVEDIGSNLNDPFFTVLIEAGALGSYEDGFWTEELSIVCDGKTHAHRRNQNHRSD